MTQTPETTKKGKTINISLSQVMYDRLKEVADYFGVALSEVLRRGVDDQYEKMNRAKFGYKGETLVKHKLDKEEMAETIKTTISQLRLAAEQNPEGLTAYFRELGYFPENRVLPNGQTEVHVIEFDGAGIPAYFQKQLNADGVTTYSRNAMSMDEVIRDLQKNRPIWKKIIKQNKKSKEQ